MIGEKISLCVIAGNCEMYISRFLDHFEKVADEIIVVRAIGSAAPDRTLEIAEGRGCKIGEYKNAPDRSDWPHVDNFAAARNLAFSLGSHQWRMWADLDDIITEQSAARIREIVGKMPVDVDLISLPYNIPEHGHMRLWKERLVRPGAATWQNEVHECMAGERELKAVSDNIAEIVHMPDGKKEDRAEHTRRNLRILESVPKEERTATNLYFLHKEYLGIGKFAEACAFGVEYLERPDASTDERYEVLCVLGSLAGDAATSGDYFHMAYQCDPRRREALAELSHLAMKDGMPGKALSYARAMAALPIPEPAPWSLRWHCYGALGVNVMARSLRACGKSAEAIEIEDRHFAENDGIITLIHATRGRPEMASKAMKAWLDNARYPSRIEHIFVVDEDDETADALRSFFRCVTVGKDTPGGGCVRAWNAGARMAKGRILIQMSDDWVPPVHWDQTIIDRIGDPERPAVLAISDGHREDKLLCMAILTRKRYEHQGFMFHPEFTGVYSDNYFTDRAYADGVVIEARDIVFEHLHPAFGKGEMDAGYARQNAQSEYLKGKEVYERLSATR